MRDTQVALGKANLERAGFGTWHLSRSYVKNSAFLHSTGSEWKQCIETCIIYLVV